MQSELRARLRAAILTGSRVVCPVCGGRFRRFLDYGLSGVRRSQALCPRCGTLERHRMIWLYLERNGLAHGTVLHVAPEPASLSRRIETLADHYEAGDIDSDPPIDLTELRFADETFDLIVCSHVLEHIPDDRTAMREICRVLKPDGTAVLQHPIKRGLTEEDPTVPAEERISRFGQHDHVRVYGRDYYERLAQAGLSVSTWDPAPAERIRFGLARPGVVLDVAHRGSAP